MALLKGGDLPGIFLGLQARIGTLGLINVPNVTITAEELKALLAERDAARALREEQEALRGALRLVTV